MMAAANQVRLQELSLKRLKEACDAIEEDVYGVLGVQNCVENYRSHGSSSPAEVQRQLADWTERLRQ
jgi:argininosuccinate lyase